MRREKREGIASKLLTCSVLCVRGRHGGGGRGAEGRLAAGQAWTESPYRNFQARRPSWAAPSWSPTRPPILRSRTRSPRSSRSCAGSSTRELAGATRSPGTSLFGSTSRARRPEESGAFRSGPSSAGTLSEAAIQIDGTGMTEDEIVREAARLYALATLTAYGAPGQFVPDLGGRRLPFRRRSPAAGPGRGPPRGRGARARSGRRRPTRSAGLYVDEFARATAGSWALRAIWERSAETGEQVLPLFLKAYTDATGDGADRLLLLFAARLYSSLEPEAAPSRIGLVDLQTGALDAAAPASFVVRHRTYAPGMESPAAFRVTWPESGAPAAVVLHYRDGALPPDVLFFSPGDSKPVPLAGVARLDWLVAGSSAGAAPAAAPAGVETLVGYPYSGLSRSRLRRGGRPARLVVHELPPISRRLGDFPRGSAPGRPRRAHRSRDPSRLRPGRRAASLRLRGSGGKRRARSTATRSGPSPRKALCRGPSPRRCGRPISDSAISD